MCLTACFVVDDVYRLSDKASSAIALRIGRVIIIQNVVRLHRLVTWRPQDVSIARLCIRMQRSNGCHRINSR